MNVVRQTSIEAFNTIKEKGLLSEKRFRVYAILFEFGPLIGSEVSKIYKAGYGQGSNSETVRNRLTELRNLGCIKEVGFAIDPITGMNVIKWDVTARLPMKLDKPKKVKCPHCNGRGHIITQQTRFNLDT